MSTDESMWKESAIILVVIMGFVWLGLQLLWPVIAVVAIIYLGSLAYERGRGARWWEWLPWSAALIAAIVVGGFILYGVANTLF